MGKLDNHNIFKITIIGVMLSLCMLSTYYFHFILKTEVLFTHLFYVPIIIASLWWPRKGTAVAVLLTLMLLASNILNPHLTTLWPNLVPNLLRGATFIFVGRLVDILNLNSMVLIDKLSRTQDYQEKLINHSNACIIVWNPEFRITGVNRAFEHLTGYTIEEVIDKKICILFSDATRKESLGKIERTVSSPYMEAVEIPFTCKDGDTHLMLCNSANIYDEDETTVLSTIAQCIDITGRKEAERILQEQKDFTANLVRYSAVPTFVLDSRHKVLHWNKACEELTGVKASEVVGTDRQWIAFSSRKRPYLADVVVDRDFEEQSKYYTKYGWSTQISNALHAEKWVSNLGGKKRYVIFDAAPINNSEGELIAVVETIQDFTVRKTAEEEIQEYAVELEHSNELKDLFTDILRHDLLNPAGIVKGFTEVLLDMEKDENKLHPLQAIERNAERLIDMIESASSFAKMESTEKLEFDKIDIGVIFKEVVENFRPDLEEKQMVLEFAAEGMYPANVNPVIEEVFANLLSNAIKYSPEKSRIIIDILDAGDNWKVTITDSGEGILDKDKPTIFERFKRVDKGGVKGTGLGLAIVRRIIDLHGGSVGVLDNPEGQGSVFWVTVRKA